MTDALQVGVANEDVLDVQDRLRFLGYYEGHIHGEYDTATEAAVSAYQHAVGESATGTLDQHGVQHLRDYSNAYHYGKGGAHADYAHHDDYHGTVEHHHHSGHAGHVEHHGDADGQAHADIHRHGHDKHLPAEQGHIGSPVEEDVVAGNGPEFYAHVVQTITNVEEHALLLGKLNDDAYLRGVAHFQQFIEGEAAKEEGDDALSGHVAMQVARSVCDAVGIYACGLIVWPVFKSIAVQISTGIAHSVSKIEYSEFSSGDAKAIRAFYADKLYALARERACIEHTLHENIRAGFQPVRELAQRHKPLPAEHQAWVAHAFDNGGAALDEVVEGLFGIQGTAKLPQVEADVYAKLYGDYYAARYG